MIWRQAARLTSLWMLIMSRMGKRPRNLNPRMYRRSVKAKSKWMGYWTFTWFTTKQRRALPVCITRQRVVQH